MAGRFFMLRDVADFAPGYFDNTVVEADCVQLAQQGEAYAESGSYTSPPFHAEAFFSLMPSWNADVPRGTEVEVQVRLASEGRWSRWFSFGRWSAYTQVEEMEPQADDLARAQGDTLDMQDGSPAADIVQMRVFLTTSDPAQSPQVRLLAVSTNAAQQMEHEVPASGRVLELPGYSCLNRDPALSGRIAGVTALTMMMNRWGRDLLPEEVARVAYDDRLGSYDNLSFLCAAAGCYGFASHIAYAGLNMLRREVWEGRAVATRVRYRGPASPGETDEAESRLPVLEGATGGTHGHLVAVYGFEKRDGKEYVLLCDPMAPTDTGVRREITLSAFAKIYTGLALFMEKGAKGAGWARPNRGLATLDVQNGRFTLAAGGEDVVPGRLADEAIQPATLCYTLSGDTVYASSAQRKFYYPAFDEEGYPRYDPSLVAGRRMTAYLIGAQGHFWVGEKMIPGPDKNAQEGTNHDL